MIIKNLKIDQNNIRSILMYTSFLYFKELTSFEKENSGKNILKKLDSHLINVYNSSVKK